MKRFIFPLIALTFFACNSEYDMQLQQGAKHWCEAKAIDKQLQNDPDNYELESQRSTLLRYIETNKELSGDPEQFEKDIKELTKDC